MEAVLLTPEILTTIFGFLPLTEQLRMASVSRLWRSVAYDPMLGAAVCKREKDRIKRTINKGISSMPISVFRRITNHYSGFEAPLFERLCSEGRLGLAAIIVEKRKAKLRAHEAFNRACRYGRLEVAQWLAKIFNFTEKDVRMSHYTLGSSCEYGHLEIMKWITKTSTSRRKTHSDAMTTTRCS